MDIALFIAASLGKLLAVGEQTKVFWVGDHRWLSLSFLFLVAAFAGVFSPRVRRQWLSAFSLLLSIVLWVDLVYWRYFGEFLSSAMLQNAWQTASISSSIFEVIHASDFFFFVDVPLWGWLLRSSRSTKGAGIGGRGRGVAAGLMGVAMMSTVVLYRHIAHHKNQGFPVRFTSMQLARELGIVGFHIFDASSAWATREQKPVTDDEVKAIYEWFRLRDEAEDRADVDKDVPFGLARGKNFFVIQFEALQPDLVDQRVQGHEIMPHLNQFARESVVFENAFDQTYLGRSSDADFAAYNSLYPTANGAVVNRGDGLDLVSVPKLIAGNQYGTLAAVGLGGNFWNMRFMHRKYGFKTTKYAEDFDREKPAYTCLGIPDASFYRKVLPWIAELPKPLFAHLLTLSSHGPHECYPPETALPLKGLKGHAEDFVQSFHYADAAFGEFIAGLKKQGLYEDSVIVLYGDHDAGLPKEDIARLALKPRDQWKVMEIDRVFFGIKLPHQKHVSRRRRVSGHLDIAPTLLHLAGVPRKGTFYFGHNLFRAHANPVVPFRDGSFADGTCLNLSPTPGGEPSFRIQTAERLPAGGCEASRAEARRRLNLSDQILDANLIPRLLRLAAGSGQSPSDKK